MPERTILRLKITSQFHQPEEISAQVRLACDRSWRIGDFRGKSTIRENVNGWVLNSGLGEDVSLEDHIRVLLDKVNPSCAFIKELSERDNVELSAVIYCSDAPALNFSKSDIEAIGSLGASLDIDLYFSEESSLL